MSSRWSKAPVTSLLAVGVGLFCGCGEDSGSGGATPYEITYPAYFPNLVIPADNPTTNEGIALGRRLYYDPILSNDGRRCGGCHDQKYGFTSPGSNILPHVNLGWSEHFLWNGKESGALEDVMLFEVEDFFEADVTKLQNHPEYPQLFSAAFGAETITTGLAAKALAQFFRTQVSSNSKFDRFLRKEELLSPEEQHGFIIFNTEKGDCFHCHSLPLMTDNGFHNIGLDAAFEGEGEGRYAVTKNPADLGKWKTPTLRNVAIRGPYMHDGRFTSIEMVVDHYNAGVQPSPTLDPIMTKPGKEHGLKLTDQEKSALIAFLKTLTDDTFTSNPNLSDPF
ncbi:MAG: c-type cytochrome [Polyangiaceae bacterium]|nr:c-type cytochrome [Polyangiaceae bacterium]